MKGSSPDQVADGLTDYLGERLFPAMDACGKEWAEGLRRDISVPVGRSGSRIIRSLPGEPPRREFGDYYDSITHVTRRESSTLIITEIGSILPNRGVWLEGGTSRIRPRPAFGPLHDRIESEAPNKIASKL